jgi:hypothetical protein
MQQQTSPPHRPGLGDRAYEVEWAYEIPIDEFGDRDRDAAKYKRRIVSTLEQARAIARRVWPETHAAFGIVEITPVEFTDPYGDSIYKTFRWEPVGDSEFYEGE